MKPFSKSLRLLSLLCSLPLLFPSCQNDEVTPYPSIITELADCPTDGSGRLTRIVLDDDTELPVTNIQSGLQADACYRALVGYTLDEGKATLYSLTSVPVLHDSTSVAPVSDPAGVASVWCTSRYLNLHLLPKTKGGQHSYGYVVDSVIDRHAYLRLHHRQGNDPAAYSTDVYASLPLEELDADRVTLRIQTFSGTHIWEGCVN